MNRPEARLKERRGGHGGKWGHSRTKPDFVLPHRFPVFLRYLLHSPTPHLEWTEVSPNPKAGGLCFKAQQGSLPLCSVPLEDKDAESSLNMK